jgi:hypothetical protein
MCSPERTHRCLGHRSPERAARPRSRTPKQKRFCQGPELGSGGYHRTASQSRLWFSCRHPQPSGLLTDTAVAQPLRTSGVPYQQLVPSRMLPGQLLSKLRRMSAARVGATDVYGVGRHRPIPCRMLAASHMDAGATQGHVRTTVTSTFQRALCLMLVGSARESRAAVTAVLPSGEAAVTSGHGARPLSRPDTSHAARKLFTYVDSYL